MIFADQDFYDECLKNFDPTALAMAYGQRPKFIRAEHSATAECENCAYSPTLQGITLEHVNDDLRNKNRQDKTMKKVRLVLKFIYSQKVTKILRNLHLFLTGTSTCQKKVEISLKFCGLLRIYKL